MDWKKLIPSIVAVITALVTVFTPQLKQLVSDNPTVAASLAAIYAVVTNLLPSPMKPDVTVKVD